MAYKYKRYYRRKRKGKILTGAERDRVLLRFEPLFVKVFFSVTLLTSVFAFLFERGRILFIGTSVLFLLLTLAFYFRLSRRRRSLMRYKKICELRYELDGWEFENWSAELLRKLGYIGIKVVGGKGEGDRGRDITCYKVSGLKKIFLPFFYPLSWLLGKRIVAKFFRYKFVLVQCKNWKYQVGEPVIRDFVGSMQYFRADWGIVMTTNKFSKYALEYVQKIDNLSLWDDYRIASLID